MLEYYSRFIPCLSIKMVELTDLLRGNTTKNIIWNKRADQAFENIKSEVAELISLKIPNMEDDFILYTDASDRGMGAALYQK